jgi:hypothetical protein
MGATSKRSRRQRARSKILVATLPPAIHAAADAVDNRVAYHFATAILKARGMDQTESSKNKMVLNTA